jgi:cell wall-associated NlpC family hydrolase
MRDNSTRSDVTRRTILKAVGVAVAVANLEGIAAATPARRGDVPHPTAVNVALDRCETAYAPDPRVAYYDVEAHTGENSVSLHGAVQSEYLREKAMDAVRTTTANERLPEQAADAARNATGVPVDTDDLTVFDSVAQAQTVQTAIAPVRGTPNEDVPLVTETVYGARVAAFERESGWTRVRTPDNYLGWVQNDTLTDPIEGTFDARLQEDVSASINGLETVYAGTDCMVEGDEKEPGNREDGDDRKITVRFRTGASMELPSETVITPRSVPTREEVVENAMYYLEVEEDVPYLWGGMTTEGIDCSGFVWMAYRMGGLTLPRDSDQQQKMGTQVSRNELRPADLLCFPGHIAISLGGARIIHSAGSADGPTINSLDPDDEDYYEYLDESFEEARRIL